MAETAVESAPGDENDDNWLYGESTGELISDKPLEEGEKATETDAARENGKDQEENDATNDDTNFDEHFEDVSQDEEPNGDADSQGIGDSDSDDSDNIKVTIGEIKSGAQAYGSLNIKRGVGLVATGPAEKPRPVTTTGKVSLEDLDGPGSINGVPAMEFNIDTIEDKPWNKPGADISDYFNYGFNEVTWSAYCDRQRRMRVNEAGVGLHSGPPPRPIVTDNRRPMQQAYGPPVPEIKQIPLPPQPMDVTTVGPPRNEMDMPSPMQNNNFQVRENTIQVMTAERREYGRGNVIGREMPPPADYFAHGAPPPDHYYPPHAPPHTHYDEPWGRHPEHSGWAPTDIKELTPGPVPMGPPLPPAAPPPHLAAPHLLPAPPYAAPAHYRAPHAPAHDRERERERERDRERDRMREHERERSERRDRDRREEEERERERERERDRERERSRSIKPERIREKSYRRERSRSRSRRHKSRSRSPRPRERSRERERDRDRSRERERSPRERERSRDRERSVKPKKDKDKDDDK